MGHRVANRVPQEALLDLLLRLTRQSGFKALLQHPHGLRRPDHEQATFLGERVVTADGKVHLAPERLVERADRLDDDFAREQASAGQLKLITKRHVKTHNSWTHNHDDMVRGFDTNHLYLHPDDAAARAGRRRRRRRHQRHRHRAGAGSAARRPHARHVRAPPRLGAPARHRPVGGVAHQGREREPARRQWPRRRRSASGMAHLTGIPVEVAPAAGPQDTSTWSGLPADRSAARRRGAG